MRKILYILLFGLAVCLLAASCGGGSQARREALLDILSSTSTDRQTDFARLDSLEQAAPDAGEHEQVVRRLVRAWLTTFETQQAAPDSVTAHLVDYLEKHGTPRERARALLLITWKSTAHPASGLAPSFCTAWVWSEGGMPLMPNWRTKRHSAWPVKEATQRKCSCAG